MTQAELDSAALVPLRPRITLPHAPTVLVLGVAFGVATLLLPHSDVTLPLALLGGILSAAALLIAAIGVLRRDRHRTALASVGAVLDAEGVPGFLADHDGRIERRNRAAEDRFGPAEPETIGRVFRDVFANPVAVQMRLQAESARNGFAREDVVTRRGHLRVSAARVGDTDICWRLEEVSDRSGGRGTDAIALPMLTAGPSGTILYMNDAFRRLTGGRARSLDLVFRDLPLVSGQIHHVETLDGPVECLVALVTGQGSRSEVYLLPAAANSSDAEPAKAWLAFEALPVPLLKVSPLGKVLAANREARALLPMPIGPQSRLSDLLEGLGRPIVDWLREAAEGRAQPGPQFLQGAGKHQDTFFQVTLNLAGSGDDRHLIAVLNDVSAYKSLEAQFVQSQKMQAIGQLAGGVAHDFNNLLTAISGHCDLLLLRHDQSDPDYPDLIQIEMNSNRAASLVGQLLAFSRKQNLVAEVLDLRDAMSDLTHLLNRLVGEKITLSLTQDPGQLFVRADKRQLEQVIMNLVVNARDAMSDGGEVRIETALVHLEKPLLRDRATVPPGPYVVVKVCDDGAGIAADKLLKIFEPFYTSKRPGEGTGLGLSTAYGIMKQSGGYIFADSQPDQGATFTLYLPSHDAPLPEETARPKPATAPISGRTDAVVLLVEDEAPVRAFASRALKLRGFTVLEADSAESALDLLADAELRVDVFVTDVIMPGKDGPTWVREALVARPETRVVFVSGYAEDAFVEHQASIPNSVFLPKPFSLSQLTRTVQEQLV